MGELHLFKKHTISLLILFLLASAVLAKPIEAHTVSPVNPNAQQTTKAVMNWLAHLPNRTENKVLSGAFGGYSHDTFSMAETDRIRSATGNRLLFTAAIMPEDGLKQQILKFQ